MIMINLVAYPHASSDQDKLIRAGVRAARRAGWPLPPTPAARLFALQIDKDPDLQRGESVSAVVDDIFSRQSIKYPVRPGIDTRLSDLLSKETP